jgi:hypothetical protein
MNDDDTLVLDWEPRISFTQFVATLTGRSPRFVAAFLVA